MDLMKFKGVDNAVKMTIRLSIGIFVKGIPFSDKGLDMIDVFKHSHI